MPTTSPPVPKPLDACVEALLAASRALVAVAARSLAGVERDLTLVQFRALVVLATHGPLRAGELGQQLGIRPASVTGLCDRLAAKGFLTRSPAPASRREVVVEVTPAGAQLIRGVMRRRRRELTQACARMTDEEQRAVTRALAVYAAAAGESPDDAWRLGW